MKDASEVRAIEPEHIAFDAIEIASLVVPLIFAIMTIVLVALNPDPAETASKDSERGPSERLEQIHRR